MTLKAVGLVGATGIGKSAMRAGQFLEQKREAMLMSAEVWPHLGCKVKP